MSRVFVFFAISTLLVAVVGCNTLVTPERVLAKVEDVAKKLDFSLEKFEVRPRIELPVTRSGLDVEIILGIGNPTPAELNVRSFSGTLGVEQQGQSYVLGDVTAKTSIIVSPNSRGNIPITVRFSYDDIKNAWKPIANVALGQAATWKLNGRLEVNVAGAVIPVPVNYSKSVNNAAAK